MDSSLAALKLVLDEVGLAFDISSMDKRKAIQKAVYLAQRAGVDLGYRFGWYLRGPYSAPLAQAYYGLGEALDSGEAVTQTLRDNLKEKLASVRPLMEVPATVELGQADWLELVASIHYLRTIRDLGSEDVESTLRKEKPSLLPWMKVAIQALEQGQLLDSSAQV